MRKEALSTLNINDLFRSLQIFLHLNNVLLNYEVQNYEELMNFYSKRLINIVWHFKLKVLLSVL